MITREYRLTCVRPLPDGTTEAKDVVLTEEELNDPKAAWVQEKLGPEWKVTPGEEHHLGPAIRQHSNRQGASVTQGGQSMN
jgi:hypothetical protein